MKIFGYFFWIVLILFASNSLFAQVVIPELDANQTLRVYLEGEIEDEEFTKRNLKFVDFVRDPKQADVQVITTEMRIGSGGRKYFLAFYSGDHRDESDFKLSFIHNPGDTDDMNRVRFTKTLKIGLLNYLSQTNLIDQVEISYEGADNEDAQLTEAGEDPWNFWVFRVSGSGGWDIEESKTNISYEGSLQADRITDTWMTRNYYAHETSVRTFVTSEDIVYTTTNIVDRASSKLVYAINNHWSAGVFLSGGRSSYINTDLSLSMKPAIEYNFFDWKDADQKIFTTSYMVGPAHYKYRDTTFLNRLEDNLWEQSLSMQLELIQPWGEIEAKLAYSGFLNDLQNYNLEAEIDVAVRISRGLSVYVELGAESVHNQLYLPKEEASLEELLLNSRKLPSTFEFGGEIGLRIYFGSIYNNIVNQRL